MLISHKYGFIFIKTEKTAGTSVEIALSKYLGSDDIITPLTKQDEMIRRGVGGRGPQNYRISLWKHTFKDCVRFLATGRRRNYQNHVSATFIKRQIGEYIWDKYFKFCYERNPWDRAISLYWQYPENQEYTLSEFIHKKRSYARLGYDLYTIDGKIVVDKVFLYEELVESMIFLKNLLGLPEIPQLPKAKSAHRIDKRPYRQVLSSFDREKISELYGREIKEFGYRW